MRSPACRVALLALLLSCGTALAGGLRPDLATLPAVPQVTLAPEPLAKALAQAPRKGRPFQFAVGVRTDLGLAHGAWDTLPSGEHRWRLRLQSAGARSLSLHFHPFVLPPGASLWIYDEAGTLVQGPYRAAHASAEGLWTAIIPQERLVIEARVPAAQAAQLRLGIANAYHGYRDWKDADGSAKAGACNVDVACPTDGVWADEIRSVARISIGGTLLCSGQLLNNARQDLDPLFLTANHCDIGEPGKPASSVVFYWNYQASACGGARNGSMAHNQAGSTLVADDVPPDFTLLRLAQAPDPAFGVFYAGWNVEGNSSDCGVGIHHPSGDEKAISFYDQPLEAVDADIQDIPGPVKAWRVVRWASGTTEGGSSGSGLWSRNHEVIGVLSGGDASCSSRNGSDFYARLDEAWEPPGSSPGGQLRSHLDNPAAPLPAGQRRVPGWDPARDTNPPALGTITSSQCGNLPRAPVGLADTYSTPVDTLLTVAAPGVLANDVDANGDALTAMLVSGTASGTLDLAGDGSFTYLPNAGFKGNDSFRYRASDGELVSASTLVTIKVGTGGGGGGGGWLALALLPLLLGAALRSRA